MSHTVLLLGHGEEIGRRFASMLADLGFQPVAAPWRGFSPRAFGRNRPLLALADMRHGDAWPLDQACRLLRKSWGESYPVVAITVARRFQDMAALLDAGADACLAPDASAALLDRKISRCLSRRLPATPRTRDDEEEIPENLQRLFLGRSDLLRLDDIASVHPGATPRKPSYRRMAPPDQDWRGVMTSDVVDRFHAGKPDAYLRWSRLHLFRMPPPEEYAVAEKVLLRRAGPPLAAAVDRSRLPAGTDVYSLVPKDGAGAGYIACLLNSRLLDFYFNRLAAVGVDGRLRLEDIRETPVPRPGAGSTQEFARTAALLAHYGPNPQTWIDRQSKDDLWAQMETSILTLYGAAPATQNTLAALHF